MMSGIRRRSRGVWSSGAVELGLVCYVFDHSFDPFDHTRTHFTAHNLEIEAK